MKKLLSLVLAIVMVLSMGVSAFADEPEMKQTSPDELMHVREEFMREQMKSGDKSDRFIVKYKNAEAKQSAANAVQNAFNRGKAKNEDEKRQFEAKINRFNDTEKQELRLYASLRNESVKNIARKSIAHKDTGSSLIEVIALDEAVYSDDFISSFRADMGGSIEYIQNDIKMEPSAMLTKLEEDLIPAKPGRPGSSDKIVAVIDTGVDVTHPALASRVTAGYDFVNDTNNVYNEGLGSEQDHGTHISGIIANTAENAQIMPLKVFENGLAYTSDIIAAIEYAETNGASVVNCSWGAAGNNQALREAMENSSMFFVCAAGNSRLNLSETPIYPAAFNLSNTISVASVNQDLGMSYFSNYGPVDIAAKGRDVNSTVMGGGYRDMNGTSMSAAYVSAAASLVDGDIKSALMTSADKLSCLSGKVTDGNYLNIENLMAGTTGQALTVTPEDDFDRWYEKTPEESWELFTASPTVQIAAGIDHTVALKSNGTVFTWGSNTYGQLGIGSSGYSDNKLIPTQVVGLTNIKAVAAGYWHTAAVDNDGRVYTWGNNIYGQIGNGYSSNDIYVRTPYKVTNISNIKAIEAGDYNTVALDNNGYMYAWGNNEAGQTVSGSYAPVLKPYKVTSISNIQDVATSFMHIAVLDTGGDVYTWGWNSYGQLGNGSLGGTRVSTPYKITSISNIKDVATGYEYTVALDNDGYVYAWGRNMSGQLGGGSSGANALTPEKITSISDIQAITAKDEHAVALDDEGYVYEIDSSYVLTTRKITSISNIKAIAAGGDHTVALDNDGNVYTWGENRYGQLGDGITTYLF